jgi:hypothetical protein
MGVEKGYFGGMALFASIAFGMGAYWLLPMTIVLYLVGKWLSKKDDQFVVILARYLQEEHVYDATPRPSDYARRPKGWGKGIPR